MMRDELQVSDASHVFGQAVTAAAVDESEWLGARLRSDAVEEMLKKEPPWWNALRHPGNKAWLEFFLISAEFKSWYDEYSRQ
jgi:hypothetical protein